METGPSTPQPQTSSSPSLSPDTKLQQESLPSSQAPRRLTHRMAAIIIALAIVIASGAVGVYMYFQNINQPAQSRIKVGVMMAFSGGSSSMGYGAMKGVQLAKKQLAADNIEIIQEDSKCDPKAAAESVRRLIDQNVAAIIGEGCSSATVAALPAVNNAKIPLISPSASSPTLSIPNDYFFRVVPPDTLQGSFMAEVMYEKGLRNVAVFYTNEPYGSGMNSVFRDKFESLGGKVVATASGEPDVIDLGVQINELSAAHPHAIFVAPNSVVTATAVLKLSRQAGMNVPIYGADIMYDTTIINNAQSAADGLIISSFPTGTKAFKQLLVTEYQKTEQLYAAPQAYDIIHALQIAVKQGATTGEQIKSVLPTISFQGVSGEIKFDQNGEISNKGYKYDLFEVKDGAFHIVTQQ